MNPATPAGWRELLRHERVAHGDWFRATPDWLRCSYVGQSASYYRGAQIIRRVDPAAQANPNEVRQ